MHHLSLHNLKSAKQKTKKRVGRGNASGKGTYSGRGIKGQKARSGVSGLKIKGLRRRLMAMPKSRGFTSPKDRGFSQGKAAVVNVGDLEKAFEANAVVSPKSLAKKGLIETPRHGAKILGQGTLNKALTINNCALSASAREQIEKAGGSIK